MTKVAAYNPGGVARSRKNVAALRKMDINAVPRRFYTVKEKVEYCERALEVMGMTGISQTMAATNLGLDNSVLSKWIRNLPILKLQVSEGDGGNKLVNHKGKVSQVASVHDELLDWVEEYRVNGFSLSKKMLVFQATRLLPPESSFRSKSLAARTQVISRWMAQNRLTIRTGTHEAQQDPRVTLSEALDFIVHIARPAVDPSLRHRDKRFIINMDQTPVFFSMHATTTVATVGEKTIHIRTAKQGAQRATVAVAFTAAGNQLKSLIIFKGKELTAGGRILSKELKSYPAEATYATQEKAWMSERMMLLWVETVLKPYVATAPPGITPLLFLDSFKVHMMASINNAINDLGVQVIIIPPGCTGLTQPVDVGYNKPFKNCVRDYYEDWMMASGRDLKQPPRRLDIATWVVEAEKRMTGKIMTNAWKKTGLEYFPVAATSTVDVATPVGGAVHDDGAAIGGDGNNVSAVEV